MKIFSCKASYRASHPPPHRPRYRETEDHPRYPSRVAQIESLDKYARKRASKIPVADRIVWWRCACHHDRDGGAALRKHRRSARSAQKAARSSPDAVTNSDIDSSISGGGEIRAENGMGEQEMPKYDRIACPKEESVAQLVGVAPHRTSLRRRGMV